MIALTQLIRHHDEPYNTIQFINSDGIKKGKKKEITFDGIKMEKKEKKFIL